MENKIMERMSVANLFKVGAGLVGLLTALAGVFVFFDARYVEEKVYALELGIVQAAIIELEDKTVEVFESYEEDRTRELNELRREIKNASALPLIVRRDVLLSRTSLTPEQAAELNVLRAKLSELNIN